MSFIFLTNFKYYFILIIENGDVLWRIETGKH